MELSLNEMMMIVESAASGELRTVLMWACLLALAAIVFGSLVSYAERKARAEAAAKARAEAEAKRKADRIALLQTNLTAEVSALMARKRWPEDLARLYLQHELNTLIGTVEVSADVKPQGVK